MTRALSIDGSIVTQKVDNIIDRDASIQSRNTFPIRRSTTHNISTHPWLKDKQYVWLFKKKMRAKKEFQINNSEANSKNLRCASIALSAKFNQLRDNYYQDIVSSSRGYTRKFYQLLKTKRRGTSGLLCKCRSLIIITRVPLDLPHWQQHLSSCFAVPPEFFASNYEDLSEQILECYWQNYNMTHQERWNNYNNFFSHQEIARAIVCLDVRKDSGPMGITARFIKFDIGKMIPLLQNIFDAIMMSGIVPDSWKSSDTNSKKR